MRKIDVFRLGLIILSVILIIHGLESFVKSVRRFFPQLDFSIYADSTPLFILNVCVELTLVIAGVLILVKMTEITEKFVKFSEPIANVENFKQNVLVNLGIRIISIILIITGSIELIRNLDYLILCLQGDSRYCFIYLVYGLSLIKIITGVMLIRHAKKQEVTNEKSS